MKKIAVVNSKSFGKFFPEHIQRLQASGEVDFHLFEPTIKGDNWLRHSGTISALSLVSRQLSIVRFFRIHQSLDCFAVMV